MLGLLRGGSRQAAFRFRWHSPAAAGFGQLGPPARRPASAGARLGRLAALLCALFPAVARVGRPGPLFRRPSFTDARCSEPGSLFRSLLLPAKRLGQPYPSSCRRPPALARPCWLGNLPVCVLWLALL